ncbi:MATE family efflux transporter [Candidatus Woesearchaeota archaeon]|nr:MATE family efflux transporter [Candidatus Woesearchaeota archaeon]
MEEEGIKVEDKEIIAGQGNKLLNGSIIKSLLSLSIPIIIGNLLHTAYQLTDIFWVGRLGAGAVASISLSFPVIFLFISLGIGLSAAGSILIAQYKGKDHQQGVDFAAGQAISLTFLVAMVMSILGYLFTGPIISLMGAEEAVAAGSISYLHISFISMTFVFSYMSFQNLLRGVGEVKIPMFITLGTVLLNLIIDPLFIMGYGIIPSYGVTGAAIATAITQGLAFAVALGVLITGRYGIKLRIKNLRFHRSFVKKLFSLGIPTALEMSTKSLGMVFMTFLVAGFGTIVTAAYGIGMQFFSLVILPAIGLSMATSTLIGQHIGAENIPRAEKIVRKASSIGFLGLSALGVIGFIFARQISSVFIPGQEAVIAESALFIRIMAFTFGFVAIQQALNGVFRGAGKTATSMGIAVVSLWLFELPCAFILSRYTPLQATGLWVAFPVSNVVAAALAVTIFLKGSWKENKVIHDMVIPDQEHQG